MTVQHDQSWWRDGNGSGKGLTRALALLLAVAAAAGIATSPVSAQQDWTPTVATVPGGTFHAPLPGAVNRAPSQIDPRFFPSSRNPAPAPRQPSPQGGWSPIVTGALPRTDGRDPAEGNAARAVPGAVAAPHDGPTPVRPVPAQAAAAAGTATDGAAPSLSGEGADEPPFKKPGPLDALPPNASAAQQYCFNTADSAADARFAWQAKKIQDMEAELDQRARQLEAKTEEYKRWLERRDAFSRKAHEKLVGFYARMRPDAAAVQLATLDEEMAAAVVMKLQTKAASQIMGEMDPERAAKIATIISGAAKLPPDKQHAGGPAGTDPPSGDSPPSADAAPGAQEPGT